LFCFLAACFAVGAETVRRVAGGAFFWVVTGAVCCLRTGAVVFCSIFVVVLGFAAIC